MVDIAAMPDSLEEALELRKNGKWIPYAGGTDLMVRRKNWSGTLPKFDYPVLFLNKIDELKGIRPRNNVLVIGTAATLSELQQNELVPEILKRAAAEMASPAVRNLGTIGGNICNASPAGDTLPALYALEASVVLQSLAGRRELPIEAFIKGPGRTDMSEDELLIEVNIPLADFNRIYYKKVGTRKAEALSKLSFAGLARVTGERLEDIRMAFGAVGATVVRVREAENFLKGTSTNDLSERLNDLIDVYSNYIKPIDDQRSSAVYRKQVSLGLMEAFVTGLKTE